MIREILAEGRAIRIVYARKSCCTFQNKAEEKVKLIGWDEF